MVWVGHFKDENLFGLINNIVKLLIFIKMYCTVWFQPGPNKSRVIQAIKRVLNISLAEVKDAVEIQRVKCEKSKRRELIIEIEKAGGKEV